ncbi:uncharacterized protein EV420DRAFT_836050 [Desarmillaria tabescens]|uniref:Actin-like ATPase domain-containing protein n=1 Tax=Armillaria tabescens TaxID=1929756 RepID=A0AA39MWB1_ARMTA|nr:uncharacterized protein EV420DRAFT_836050 [Desarmillaria tabescens]KAK0448967.1 hypothetical protein EV420DRAFT_836050 [Desarmillaria tabescens]
MPKRKPYNGTERKLVIAMDLGTTFSGVSYSILDPGRVPEIKGVTRFPSQEHVGGDAKIPTIMYYDQDGSVKAVGAEALKQNVIEDAEDEGWLKCSLFKLRLRPPSTTSDVITEAIPPLPDGMDIVAVFADFYAYLFECTKTFILDTHQNAASIWKSVEENIEFVLSHPNGWEGPQQSKMREAAIDAGLIPDDDGGHSRVHFVTEGETSLHFCVNQGLESYIQDGEGVVIVDAGGGTVDISTYSSIQSPNADSFAFEEISAPACNFTGSVYVTARAKLFLAEKLAGSRFADEVELIAECFDATTKLRFRDIEEASFIKFGTMKDRDPKLDIRSGQLKLAGSDVASFFEPSIASMIRVIDNQRAKATKPVSSVFLVGGFAASDWLFSKLKEHLEPLEIQCSRPDSHVNKAVADGALSFYLDHVVAARVSRYDYGISVYTHYNPYDAEHYVRSGTTFYDGAGALSIPGQFSIILPKDTQVSETTEFRHSFSRNSIHLADLQYITTDIKCYRGVRIEDPRWIDKEPDAYSLFCTVAADTSEVAKSLKLRRRPDGGSYFALVFDIVLLFGRTELKAQLSWKENGVEKR